MANLNEHCKRTFDAYGLEGKEIHQWLDAPVKLCGGGHRQFRHDSETVKLAAKKFGKKYGVELVETIALDHIMFDHAKKIGVSFLKPLELPKKQVEIKPFFVPKNTANESTLISSDIPDSSFGVWCAKDSADLKEFVSLWKELKPHLAEITSLRRA